MGRTKQYTGDSIEIQFDPVRCIHAEECIKRLPRVFEVGRRPWVDPNAAGTDEISAMILHCPTGALHFDRLDGGAGEQAQSTNTVTLAPHGPLYIKGRGRVVNGDGEVLLEDTRVALCRCGDSQHKPLCDNKHTEVQWDDPGGIARDVAAAENVGDVDVLEVTVAPNGPLILNGTFQLVAADGTTSPMLNKIALCRCGASSQRPFCDGSHVIEGFEAN